MLPLFVRLYVRPLSNLNSFDQNFMKLGHIIKYHNVFKFDNGPYLTMPSELLPFIYENSPFEAISAL